MSDKLAGDTTEQMLEAGIAFGVEIRRRGAGDSGLEATVYMESKRLDALYTVAV